jgi:hypothetical protein
MAQSTTLSTYKVYMLLKKRVETYHFRLVTPTLTTSAQDVLRASPIEFRRMYGDECVNAVTFGGALYVLIEAQASSDAEAKSSRTAARGAAGPVSGSIDVQQRLSQVAKENRLASKTVSIGVANPPPLQRPAEETFFQYIDRLFDYFNSFNNNLKDQIGSELDHERLSYDAVEGRPRDTLNFNQQKQLIYDCINLKDEIKRREDIFGYAVANPHLYQNGSADTFQNNRDILTNAEHNLDNYVTGLFESPADTSNGPPISLESLPTLPTPIPVIDLPLQVTLSVPNIGTVDLLFRPTIINVSASKGRMIEIPPGGNIAPVLTLAGVTLQLVSYDLDVRVICKARKLITPDQPLKTLQAITTEAQNTTGLERTGVMGGWAYPWVVGLAFRLEGSDSSRYTIFYRASFYDRDSYIAASRHEPHRPPSLTPYASDGEPIGNIDLASLTSMTEIPDVPYFTGLELQLEPRR